MICIYIFFINYFLHSASTWKKPAVDDKYVLKALAPSLIILLTRLKFYYLLSTKPSLCSSVHWLFLCSCSCFSALLLFPLLRLLFFCCFFLEREVRFGPLWPSSVALVRWSRWSIYRVAVFLIRRRGGIVPLPLLSGCCNCLTRWNPKAVPENPI